MTEYNAQKHKVIFIVGPTAVGKTDVACHLADKFNGEIISCDSMQIYRGMDIGTAKPTKDELKKYPHHLIDIIDPSEDFSAAKYVELAEDAIRSIVGRGKVPIVCGGTGLYLDGILYDMDYGKGPEDPEYRKSLEERAEKEGSLALHEYLRTQDPDAALVIHPNNTKRVIRALERIHLGEESIKPFKKRTTPAPMIDPMLVGLYRPRGELYERINIRVDRMMEDGLLDEVRGLLDSGLTPDMTSMQGIGYKELIDHLQGGCTLEDAVNKIKLNTRHYAKRQLTWFRSYDKMIWMDTAYYVSEEIIVHSIDCMIRYWLDSENDEENDKDQKQER